MFQYQQTCGKAEGDFWDEGAWEDEGGAIFDLSDALAILQGKAKD